MSSRVTPGERGRRRGRRPGGRRRRRSAGGDPAGPGAPARGRPPPAGAAGAPVEVSSTVGLLQGRRQAAELDRPAAETVGQGGGLGPGPVDDQHSPTPGTPASAWAMPSPMSPAPSTRMVRPSRVPSRSAARATAACDSDVVPRAMAVSDRTRLPTSTAWRNSRSSTGPAAPSPGPPPTPPHLPEDLALAEHGRVEPDATWNRWATAASS